MPLALALDLGTTSIAAVAVAENGRLIAQAQVPNDAAVAGLPPGFAEQNPLRIREVACGVLRQLAAALPEPPRCLGVTGQMHGGLVVDSTRRPLTHLLTWQDRRANLPDPKGTGTYLETLLSQCPEAALDSTGCRPAAGFLPVMLYVLGKQGNQFADAGHRAACVADWIAAELTDGPVFTDPGDAASWGIYDLEHREWSASLTAACGLARELLPAVRESGAVLGGLSRGMAQATNLPVGLPVCNAVGDNQAAVLGSVPAGSRAIQINVGTGGQINWPTESFTRLEGMETRYLPMRRFMLVGPGLSGGDAYAWVNRTAAQWLAAFGVEHTTDEVYVRMNELVDRLPEGDDGLVCEPLFRGTRWKPKARGEFRGVTFDNFSLGHVARAVLRGIAQGMYAFYDGAGSSRPTDADRIIGSGNGFRKNPRLVREISRRFGLPVWFPAHSQEAAYGAALLAGASTGLWPDLETASQNIRLIEPGSSGR
jgi:sugar (pentulose or hexulose) kinase